VYNFGYKKMERSLVFGKIEYLNLLPFHVFMKRHISSSHTKMSMHHKRGVPSKINQEFLARRVDAAFISSISAKGKKHVNLGIVAKKEVLSVLVVPSQEDTNDSESATSNLLAKILHLHGKVLIGDKALRYYLSGAEHTDMAGVWNKKYKLPFVFALLCYHKDKGVYQKIEKKFTRKKIKIPTYILEEASKRTHVSKKDILNYLQYISYKLDTKAKLGLKKFYTQINNLD
jgi:chorismate dehydratase